ncbi:MAG TPA: hypothetical protein VLQ45_12825, partial [Thermoanaerobaculia bacterium]|nr:hypothetical protein [Thermoanaerobaculia bacterium]
PPPAPGEAPAGLPPGTRLLLPPRPTVRTGPRPGTEVVLQFPEEPPPVPVPEPVVPPGTAPAAPRPTPPAGTPPPAARPPRTPADRPPARPPAL